MGQRDQPSRGFIEASQGLRGELGLRDEERTVQAEERGDRGIRGGEACVPEGRPGRPEKMSGGKAEQESVSLGHQQRSHPSGWAQALGTGRGLGSGSGLVVCWQKSRLGGQGQVPRALPIRGEAAGVTAQFISQFICGEEFLPWSKTLSGLWPGPLVCREFLTEAERLSPGMC